MYTPAIISLHVGIKRNITLSNICEAAPRSMLSATNGFNRLPEVHFKFSFNPICKWTMFFLTSASSGLLKSREISDGPEQEFQLCFADLTRGF